MAMKLADLERLNLRALPTDAKPIVAEAVAEPPKPIRENAVQLRIRERCDEVLLGTAVHAFDDAIVSKNTQLAIDAFKEEIRHLEKIRDALLEAAATK